EPATCPGSRSRIDCILPRKREGPGALAPGGQVLLPPSMSVASLDAVLPANNGEISGVLPVVSEVRQTEAAIARKTGEAGIAELRQGRINIGNTVPETLNTRRRGPVGSIRNIGAVRYLISDPRLRDTDVA